MDGVGNSAFDCYCDHSSHPTSSEVFDDSDSIPAQKWWRQDSSLAGWPPTLTFKIHIKLTQDNLEDFVQFFVKYLDKLSESLWNAVISERIEVFTVSKPEPCEKEPTWRLRFKHFFNEGSTPTLVTENELRVTKDSESEELQVEFVISVVEYGDIPNLYQYLRRMASSYRTIAFEWTLKRANQMENVLSFRHQ